MDIDTARLNTGRKCSRLKSHPCCKFGIEYAFKQRDKVVTKWWSVQNMESFDANFVIILLVEKVQRIRFSV
jgi:predicted methyltransferase